MNLCARMRSISSACLILIEIRIELTLGSMSTFSFSLREMVNGVNNTSREEAASISGTLCRSTVCDAKLSSVNAAVRVERTHERYGRSVFDCNTNHQHESTTSYRQPEKMLVVSE